MSQTIPTREQLVATALEFVRSYNQWTLQAIITIRSPDCMHHTLPASLQVPPRSNAEYKEFMGPMLSVFRGVQFSVINNEDIIVDVEARRVVLHCRNQADTDAGDYTNEYIFSLTIDKRGTKIDKIIEFIDASYTVEFKRRIALTRASTPAVNKA